MLSSFRVYQFAGLGNVYSAYAAGVNPAVYTATALTSGILYNGSSGKGVTAYVLAISYGLSVASTVASSIGIATGVTTAPTTTTAATLTGNLNTAGPASQCTAYKLGTVSAAATAYWPTGRVQTGAITVATDDDNVVNLGGLVVVPPGSFAAVVAGATLTTSAIDIGFVWYEIAND